MEIKMPPKIHAYAYHICRACHNGSYTMATKPIKFLELHYTMTQFLINVDIAAFQDFKVSLFLPHACEEFARLYRDWKVWASLSFAWIVSNA